jgi:hypothetical protein
VYATGAFYDALVRVDGYTELEVTDAAQRVQRSGFPDAYADHEEEGRALASSLYGLSPASLVCELPPVGRAAGEDVGGGGGAGGGGDQVRAAPDAAAAALVAELETWGTRGWQASAVEPSTLSAGGPAADPGGSGAAGDGGGDQDADAGTGAGGQPAAGAVVVLDAAAAAEPARTAWALAHSAVALAERHGVVRVEVDGRVWDRSQPDTGWLDGAGAAAGGDGPSERPAPGDGRVRVWTG